MDIVQKYTEQTYCDRHTLLQDFEAGVGDVIWNEILQYRRQFRFEIHCFSRPYELILCRHVLWRIQHVEQQLMQYAFFLAKDGVVCDVKWRGVAQELYDMETIDVLWIQQFCRQRQIADGASMISIIFMDVPFAVRLFLCAFLPSLEQDAALHLLFLKESIPMLEDVIQEVVSFDTMGCEHDMTYMLLRFLERLQLKISDRMVLLKGSKRTGERTLELAALQERYPQYSKELLSFYVTHRSIGHYYTIQQYAAYCKVCYETARYSLEQLVELRWYQKRKMGKKFVYYI